jgi:glutamyl-tRNA synthetase
MSGSLHRGRYAPSPTGLLHVGNARTALAAWLSIRSKGGIFIWRLEDLDPPRLLEGASEAAIVDLQWLGVDWDEGPDVGGPYKPYVQSQRHPFYELALQQIADAGRLFPCRLSRTDLLSISSAPHGRPGLPPYPAFLRPESLPRNWYAHFISQQYPDAALRFWVHTEPVVFDDLVFGQISERVDLSVGDFVLKRRDGLYAYQLAVVVDDLSMHVTEVVRGSDLLASTGRQMQLIDILRGDTMIYGHIPIVVDTHGKKLSKRHKSMTLRSLKSAGVKSEQLVGYLAYSLGLIDRLESCQAKDLPELFDWSRVPAHEWALPADFESVLRRI